MQQQQTQRNTIIANMDSVVIDDDDQGGGPKFYNGQWDVRSCSSCNNCQFLVIAQEEYKSSAIREEFGSEKVRMGTKARRIGSHYGRINSR